MSRKSRIPFYRNPVYRGIAVQIAVLGLVLAWAYERTGSIWAPVIVHGVYNAVVTTILYVAIARGLPIPGAG